jgi:AraC family transcriptional regulator
MLILSSGEYLGRLLHRAHLFGLPLTLSAYPPGHTYPWHVHEIPTLFVLLAGQHQDENRRVTFDQSPLSVVFHPVIGPHATSVGPDGMVGLNLELTEAWLDRCELRRRDLAVDYRLLDSVSARLLGLRLAALACGPGETADAEVETVALDLVATLVREPSLPARTPRWLPRAQEFLHAHASSPVGLRDVAAAVGVHPVYCARAFRRALGCTVSTYLRALRLLDAGRLILKEKNSLADVALRVGFADQAHFTRSCSRDLGFPPGRLQQMRRELFPAAAGSSRSGLSGSRKGAPTTHTL